MGDAMVVARMTNEKKSSVAKKLADLNTNASAVINQLYDYIEATGSLPFDEGSGGDAQRQERLTDARSWVCSLTRLPEGNAFQCASDEEIRRARIAGRRDTEGGDAH